MAQSGKPYYPVTVNDHDYFPEGNRWAWRGTKHSHFADAEVMVFINQEQIDRSGQEFYTESYFAKDAKKRAKKLGIRVLDDGKVA